MNDVFNLVVFGLYNDGPVKFVGWRILMIVVALVLLVLVKLVGNRWSKFSLVNTVKLLVMFISVMILIRTRAVLFWYPMVVKFVLFALFVMLLPVMFCGIRSIEVELMVVAFCSTNVEF